MRIYIDKDFPGGNIQINRIEGNTIYLEQEIRDTTEWWFYFSFRATAKVKGEYTFIFENGDVISRFGPAISLDGYNYFFNKETFINNHCFKYSFEENSTVYFAFSYPYQEKHFGVSIKDYLLDAKMVHALSMLKTKKYTINDIAVMTGFSSSSHFISLFKEKYKVTPMEYMEKYSLKNIKKDKADYDTYYEFNNE